MVRSSKKSKFSRQEKKRKWEIICSFNYRKRLNNMMEEPTEEDIKQYSAHRSRLILNEEEKQEVLNTIENLKSLPDRQGKLIKPTQELRTLRSANEKVRIIFLPNKIKKTVSIKLIQFRPKLAYKDLFESFELTENGFLFYDGGVIDLNELELLID